MNEYELLYKNIISSLPDSFFSASKNFNDLKNDPYIDKYMTAEQNIRDKQITRLLQKYVDSYYKKTDSNVKYKSILFYGFICITLLLIIFLVIILFKSVPLGNKNVSDMVSIISVCASLIGAPIGILKIITEYVFPTDEETNITQIVKAIQENDLANKKACIEALKNKDVVNEICNEKEIVNSKKIDDAQEFEPIKKQRKKDT